jgi:hypothetical protein
MGDNWLMDDDLSLTEAEAARLWALAYNTHDPSALAPILSKDVRVMSRWVVNDLVGRDRYLKYLTKKFQTFAESGSLVRVELGRAPGDPPDEPGRPCAFIEQNGVLLATVLFEVVGGLLTQVSIGPYPSPAACERSGDYPGLGFDDEPVN